MGDLRRLPARKGPPPRPSTTRALVKLAIASTAITLLHVTFLHSASPHSPAPVPRLVSLTRRALSSGATVDRGGEGAPDAALIHWREIWADASPQSRPAVFVVMICWLVFLFAFVGITASDFFCPNLSTIASRLGMSESVAGVTFLAFSNGSPDVFSTFAALRSDSGALAIGELIGAASFIVSVVAGTMCIIEPFQVSRYTFLRDVGFFTLAVGFTLAILWDGHIHLWESLLMVTLYVIYAFIVGFGSWYRTRRDKRREAIRRARSEFAVEEYRDEPETGPASARSRASSIAPTPGPPRLTLSRDNSGASTPTMHSRGYSFPNEALSESFDSGAGVTLIRARSNSHVPQSPLGRRPAQRSSVRPSLLGAIEFRDVVNSLSADSTARSLAIFSAGPDEHGHSHYFSSRSPNPSRAVSPGTSRPRATTFSGSHSAHPSLADHRRPTWAHATTEEAATATAKHSGAGSDHAISPSAARDPWADDSDSDEEGEAPLVDLSSGVDNPWQASSSTAGPPPPLRVTIPSFSSSATSSRTARARGATSPAMSRSRSSSASPPRRKLRRMPSILLTTDEGNSVTVLPPVTLPHPPLPWHKTRPVRIARAVFLALFPSLDDWGAKSLLGRATAVLCVPAILLLNLTLPVVDTDQDECDSYLEKEEEEAEYRDDVSEEGREGPLEGFLIDTGEEGTPRPAMSGRRASESEEQYDGRQTREAIAHEFHSQAQPHHSHPHAPHDQAQSWSSSDGARVPMGRFNYASSDTSANDVPGTREPSEATASPRVREASTESELVIEPIDAEVLTRWLTVVQCVLGPTFVVTALLLDDLKWWQPLSALLFGLALAGGTYWAFDSSRHPGRIVLCFVGFLVAMVWIMCIVNEVVAVLQTIGHIFGLSDAILGLTIFAMGNSLGDLVANATVARMGFPSMAIAACFGGPMLNILLGVGLSGTYLIGTGGEPLDVHIGRTLLVSGAGLLAVLLGTLVVVPMNGFWMGRRVGWGLVGAYSVVLSINVAVEIWL